jgi:hypothetical protein
MQDATLARRILEKLDDAFPRKLHLHELRALLPEHLVDAAALFITEQGRLYLHAIFLDAQRKPRTCCRFFCVTRRAQTLREGTG